MSRLLIFAGPNGSGKSSVTSYMQLEKNHVNADCIRDELQCDDLKAAEIAEETREYFLKGNEDFSFETVLSTPRNIDLIARAKEMGRHTVCIYVLTCNPEINLQRVRHRVLQGGHDVAPDKVITRYRRALKLIPELFPICDELYIFDNSRESPGGKPEMVVSWVNRELELKTTSVWTRDMLESLISGKYPDEYIPNK